METTLSLLAILTGLLVRLVIPILVTAVVIFALRKLDAHWQAEAQTLVSIEKQECWKIKGCSPEQIETCTGASSPLPCWQAYRSPNGYCAKNASLARFFCNACRCLALNIEPRRM